MSTHLGFGVLSLLAGLALVAWPYRIARYRERMDAIGSKRDVSKVEPTRRRVGLTRVIGVVLAFFGLVAVLVAVAGATP